MKRLYVMIVLTLSTSGAVSSQEVALADTSLPVPAGWARFSESEWRELERQDVQERRSHAPWLRSELSAFYSLRPNLFRGMQPVLTLTRITWPKGQEFDRKRTAKALKDECIQQGWKASTETLNLEERGVGVTCASSRSVSTQLFIPRSESMVRASIWIPWTAQEEYVLFRDEISGFLSPLWDNRGKDDAATSVQHALDKLVGPAVEALVILEQTRYVNDRDGLSFRLPLGFERVPAAREEERAGALAGVKNFESFELEALFVCPEPCSEVSMWKRSPDASDRMTWLEQMQWLSENLGIEKGLTLMRAPEFDGTEEFTSRLYWDSGEQVVWRTWKVRDSSGAWIARQLTDGTALALWIIDPAGVPIPTSLDRARYLLNGLEVDRN